MNINDRMKKYEALESKRRFMPLLPICARIDGKNFSKFTKDLKKPYDKRLSDLMMQTALYLLEETNALTTYTQSDEISLTWYSDHHESQIFFDGKIQKMTSILASMATAFFNKNLSKYIEEKTNKLVLFDCRVWQLPTLEEAANVFLWRELDASRNSIEMAARNCFSHKELHKKNGTTMQQMLLEKGVDWQQYPTFFKRGTYIQRKKVVKKFSQKEIEKLPAKHEAKTNPDFMIERNETQIVELPPLLEVQNRVAVIFKGEKPILQKTQ